jgi:hypothetical protein
MSIFECLHSNSNPVLEPEAPLSLLALEDSNSPRLWTPDAQHDSQANFTLVGASQRLSLPNSMLFRG